MSSRERLMSAKRPDEFNPIGESLAHNFLQNRNQYSESKNEYNNQNTNNLTFDRVGKNNSLSLHDRGDRDLWANGGEHLSTNKLSMMLSDMQGRLKDLPTPDPSEDGLMWGRTASTDSHDTSELDSVLFGGLRTDISDSPPYHNSRSMSPGVNLDHKRISLHGPYSRQHDDDNDSLSSVSTASTNSFQRSNRRSRLSKPTSYGYGMTAAVVADSRLRSSSGQHRLLDPESDYISDGASVTSLESAGGKSSQIRKLEINPVLSKLSQQQPQTQQQQTVQEAQNRNSQVENLALRGMIDPSANDKIPSLLVSAISTTSSLNNNLSTGSPNNIDVDKKNSTSPVPARSATTTASTPSAAPVSSIIQSPTGATAKPRSTTPTNIPRAVSSNSSNQSGQLSSVRNSSNTDSAAADARPSRARDTTPSHHHRSLSLESSGDTMKKTPEHDGRQSSNVERGPISRSQGGLFINEPPMSPLRLSKVATEALPLTPIQRNNSTSKSSRSEPFHHIERGAAAQHPSSSPAPATTTNQRLAIETPPPPTGPLQLSRIATESLPLTPVQSGSRNNSNNSGPKTTTHTSTAPSRSTTTVTMHTPPSTAASSNGSGEKKTTPPQGVVQKVEIDDNPYPTRGRMRIRSTGPAARTSIGEHTPVLNSSNSSGSGSGGNSTTESNTVVPKKAVVRAEITSPAAVRQQERDRARSQSATRSRSVTRSDPTAASTITKRTTTPNGHRRALTDSNAATTILRSPPAAITPPPTNRSHQTPTNTSKPLEQNGARKGRMSFGSSNSTPSAPTATRSRSRSPAGAATSRSTLLPSTTTRNNSRTVALAPQVQQTRSQPRKFSLPGASIEQITTAQQAQQTQRGNNSRLRGGTVSSKVNTSVVPVRSPNASGPRRSLSSSSLNTQGTGSTGTGSRSSTPTSTSSTGGQNGRLSRQSSFKRASSGSGVPAPAAAAPVKDRSLTLVQLKSVNPFPLRSSSSPRHSLESSNSFRASPKGTGSPGQKQQSPSTIPKRFFDDGQPSPLTRKPSYSRQSYPLGPERSPKLVVDVTSPAGDAAEDGFSPVSLMHGKSHRLFQPPADAIPYQSCSAPLRFMMTMIHLSQESISGVYDSANYNPSPMHFPRSPKSVAKYLMRGVDTQLDKTRLDRDKFSREASRDDADQGSGRTETTRATMSSTDTFDQDDGSQG